MTLPDWFPNYPEDEEDYPHPHTIWRNACEAIAASLEQRRCKNCARWRRDTLGLCDDSRRPVNVMPTPPNFGCVQFEVKE